MPSRDGAETVRDPRGFAVKFYTNEGNYDLVGSSMPVFFIRDGMKFADMVHSMKPNPVTNLNNVSTLTSLNFKCKIENSALTLVV